MTVPCCFGRSCHAIIGGDVIGVPHSCRVHSWRVTTDYGKLHSLPSFPSALMYLPHRYLHCFWRRHNLHWLCITLASYAIGRIQIAPSQGHAFDICNRLGHGTCRCSYGWIWNRGSNESEARGLGKHCGNEIAAYEMIHYVQLIQTWSYI